MPTPFSLTADQQTRQSALRTIAARHSVIPVNPAIIGLADSSLIPKVAVMNGEIAVAGSSGRIGAASRELRETTVALLVARKRCDEMHAVISDRVLSQMEAECDAVQAALLLLRDQISAAREDRFDAQDRKRAGRAVAV